MIGLGETTQPQYLPIFDRRSLIFDYRSGSHHRAAHNNPNHTEGYALGVTLIASITKTNVSSGLMSAPAPVLP